MKMMIAKFLVWLTVGLLLFLFLWVSINPESIGQFDLCENPIIYSARKKADDSWNNRDYLKSAGESLRALWMKSDCRLRITMSKPFFRHASNLEKQGQIKEAIDICMIGARIMGQYDLEGAFMYQCDVLTNRYHVILSGNASPTATPKTEP